MVHFKLQDYALHSQKIPTDLLNDHLEAKIPSHRKIIIAHALDYGVVAAITLLTLALLNVGVSGFMLTSKLLKVWHKMNLDPVSVFTFITVSLTYFSFCNFFNQGQTYGHSVTKTRIQISEKDTQASIHWALFSVATIVSFGLFYNVGLKLMKKHGMGTFAVQDYLYNELMSARTETVNLVVHESHSETASVARAA